MNQTTVKKNALKDLRYKFYHDLDQLYHRFFDEIAQSDIRDGDAATLTQNILKARQDSLKYLLEDEEIKEYEENSPQD
jgi:hercynine metabolism small protein